MSAPYQRIQGHVLVLRAFGRWPAFHDAEVRSVSMSRDAESPGSVPEVRLDVCLHAFEWTQDPQPTANHHLVRLRFHDIEEVILEDFNHQNAILEFKIEDCVGHPDMPNGLEFTFVPAYGLSGIFRAGSAEVVSVVPCDERGNPRPQAEPVGAASSHPPTP